MSKRCARCEKVKSKIEFYRRSDKPHLLNSYCKDCILSQRREYRKSHLEQFKEKDRKYYRENKNKRLAYSKEWTKRNRSYINAQNRKKYRTDVHYSIRQRLHNLLRMALKRSCKYSLTSEYLGCSLGEFRLYFESMFTEGMTWSKFMSGEIHIDHIEPCCNFNLEKKEDQHKCFHYSNLQPLWAFDNMSKGGKLPEDTGEV